MSNTLQEFISAYNEYTPEQAAEGFDDEMFLDESFEGCTVLDMSGAWMLRKPDGSYWTLIERAEPTGTFEEVAKHLFFDWYVSEHISQTEWTESDLCDLLRDWSAWRGYEWQSADEMQHAIMSDHAGPPDQRPYRVNQDLAWLEWFIDVWNDWQERDDMRRAGLDR